MLKSFVISTFAVFAISFGLFHAGEIATLAERIAEAFVQHFAVNLVNPIAPSAPTHTQQLAAAAQPTTQQFQDLSSQQHQTTNQRAQHTTLSAQHITTTSTPLLPQLGNPLLAYATKADPDNARGPSPGSYAATI